MSYVKPKLKNNSSFPVEVFPDAIRESIESISENKSIPIDLVAGAALFAVGALAGNIYILNTNGGEKSTLYVMMVAPSGVGKTPAYQNTCGKIIAPLRVSLDEKYKAKVDAWRERMRMAKSAKTEFSEPHPHKTIRMAEDATLEAILKHAETSPAGFGVFYDEGERLFAGVNQFKKDSSSVAFWNENFNGKIFESLRVDEGRDRFVKNLAISLLIGMQTSRLTKYFTQDVLASGLAYRFLICQGDYMLIKENVDYFGDEQQGMCAEWSEIIRGLFHKGAELTPDDRPIKVEFSLEGKITYNDVMNEVVGDHNKIVQNLKKEDENIHILAAGAKLQAYVARLALVLAIIDNHTGPVVSKENVENAYKLYKFFKNNSRRILLKLNNSANTGLTESELELLEGLPDQEFTTEQAEQVCVSLGLNLQFFKTSYHRKYKNKFIKSAKRGLYEKM